jgi:hypothetical protein
MITREFITEQYNRVVVNYRYPATCECVCTVQRVNEAGVVEWYEGNLIFTDEDLSLTDQEINELNPEQNDTTGLN